MSLPICKFCGCRVQPDPDRLQCHPPHRFAQARVAAWTKFAGAALARPDESGTSTVESATFLADQMLEEWDKRFKN